MENLGPPGTAWRLGSLERIAGKTLNVGRFTAVVRTREALGLPVVLVALGVSACGGSSQSAKLGDCVDSQHHVMSCSSSSAKLQLVSQDDPGSTQVACLMIPSPEVMVRVGVVAMSGAAACGSGQSLTVGSGTSTSSSASGGQAVPGDLVGKRLDKSG